MLAIKSCYQVHILKTNAHQSVVLLCKWCQNLVAVSCILNSPDSICAADGHYTRNSSCITLLCCTIITKWP